MAVKAKMLIIYFQAADFLTCMKHAVPGPAVLHMYFLFLNNRRPDTITDFLNGMQ